ILRSRCPDRIRECVVGPVPRATIGRDGAVDRIALEAWRGLATVTELRELVRCGRDVWAWREHRRSSGSWLGGEPRKPAPDCDVVAVRCTCGADGVTRGSIDLRLTFGWHRERPRFATRLMPDQCMHDLWIDRKGARGHERDEVHGVHSGSGCCAVPTPLGMPPT